MKIRTIKIKKNCMVSFDVETLFTNIPLTESIELVVDYIKKAYRGIKLIGGSLFKLFFYATTHFSFCDQIVGVDEIFCLINTEQDALSLYDYINSQQKATSSLC